MWGKLPVANPENEHQEGIVEMDSDCSSKIDSRANRFCDWKLLRNRCGCFMTASTQRGAMVRRRSLPLRCRARHLAEQTLFEGGAAV